jgi:hypothetical protein
MNGQDRRAWLDGVDAQINEALRYYLGPTGLAPKVNALAAGAGMVMDGTDFVDAYGASGNMMRNPSAMNALAMVPPVMALAMPGISNRLLQGAGEMAGDAARFVTAEDGGVKLFHGSPHDFDKFSMDKIGTGEGAQAYGHGLYFAENEGVARVYRDALAKGDISTPEGFADTMVRDFGHDEAIRRIAATQDGPFKDAAVSRIFSGQTQPNGRMYEVNVNANPEDFLDWDAPLSAQPQKVREAMDQYGLTPKDGMGYLATPKFDMRAEAVRRFGTDNVYELSAAQMKELNDAALSPAGVGRPDPRGEEIYRNLADEIMAKRKTYGNVAEFAAENDATAAMREAGIPGIKYLDAGSRTAGDGSRNYVVFDENLINIVRKYGIAGAAGLLGATVADVEQAMAGGNSQGNALRDYVVGRDGPAMPPRADR